MHFEANYGHCICMDNWKHIQLPRINLSQPRVIFTCIREVPGLIDGLDIEGVEIQCSVHSSLLISFKNQMFFSTFIEQLFTQ